MNNDQYQERDSSLTTHNDGFRGMDFPEVPLETHLSGKAHKGAQRALVGEPFQVLAGNVHLQVVLVLETLGAVATRDLGGHGLLCKDGT